MTRLLLVKLVRDLRTAWSRIVLMILAMSVTLTVLGGMLYTRGIVAREMSRAYLSTGPASATILFERGLDGSEVQAILAEALDQPGIIDAVVRTQLTLQVQEQGGGWGPYPLQIFVAAPDDPMRMETFTVEQGVWPPASGEILIDRSSFELLGLNVGEDVVVQAPNGTPTPLRVIGAVYDPALAPSFQEQKGHAFMSAASLPVLGVEIALDALKVQIADEVAPLVPSRDRDINVAAAVDLAARVEQAHGFSVLEIQVPEPYAHPHQAQADSLLLGLLVFGAAGLLLSAILVATMLNGLFTQQIPQMGIMKAVGARSGRVLQLYLLMTLAIAGAATAIAFVPGIVVSRAFAPAILGLLGVDAVSVVAPWWMYVFLVAAGVGLPLLFALAPIVKTSRTSVREALDYRGVETHGDRSSRFATRLSQWGDLNRTVVLAFRNIFRRRARFLLSVGLLASAGAVFIGGLSTMAGFQASLDRERELRAWDVDVQLGINDGVSANALTTLAREIPGMERVEAWSIVKTSVIPSGQRFGVTRTYPDQGHGSLAVTVVPMDTVLLSPPSLVEGRWLRPAEAGAVVLSQAAVRNDLAGATTGDSIRLSMGRRFTSWRVVGIVESLGHGGGIFVTEEGFESATGLSQPNLLRIVTNAHDEQTRVRVAQATERVLGDVGIVVRSAASVSRTEAAGAGHMLPLILAFLGLSIAIGVVGFAGLTSTMSTSVLERTREFGVMSAIGAPASTVRRLVVLEGISIAVISCAVAVVLAPPLAAIMVEYLPMTGMLQVSIPGVVVWIVVCLMGAALAALVPASHASRLTVREALAYM